MMYEYMAKIIKVYDGDTYTFEIDLGFNIKVIEKLRLANVDTPEVRGSEKVEGFVVRDYVREMILNKLVLMKVYKRGKYGRYIADVFIDGIKLADHLVDKGMARRVNYK